MDAQDEFDTDGLLGLGEAADLADCSRDTIRRAAQKGELIALMGPGPRGPQWWIREDDLRSWLTDRDLLSDDSSKRSMPRAAQQAEHGTPSSARHAQRSTADAELSSEDRYLPEIVSAEVHRTVVGDLVEQLRRVDRQVIALQFQLSQQHQLLAENAESLIEKEAHAKTVEAIAEQARQEQLRAAEQAQQAQQDIEEAKAETQKLAAELRQARAELAAWEERRRLPWWKRMLGNS